jgi:hypothetical protein
MHDHKHYYHLVVLAALELDNGHGVRNHTDVDLDIEGPLARGQSRMGRQTDVVVHDHPGDEHLDFVRGEEATGAGVETGTPVELIGTDSDELRTS